MDPEDFVNLAGNLAARNGNESEWRTAIGRAYYAAFHVGLSFFTNIGVPIKGNASAHQKVKDYLNNCGEALVARAGSRLNTLGRERHKADYELHKGVDRKLAQDSVNNAQVIIRTLKNVSEQDYIQIRLGVVQFLEERGGK